MNILFDQGTPVPLRHALSNHSVNTAFEMGWSRMENGELLSAAEPHFDAFITTDQNIRHQQNLTARRLAIVILPTTSWPVIQRHLATVVAAIEGLQPGVVIELRFPQPER